MYQALDLDHAGNSHATFCSWTDASWRSLLLQVHQAAPVVEDYYLPPIGEQHLVLVTAGDTWMESHTNGRWQGARYTPGQIGLTAPGRPTRLRWRSEVGQRTLHLYLPGSLMQRVGLELWDRDGIGARQADALAVADPMVEQILLQLEAVATKDGDDL